MGDRVCNVEGQGLETEGQMWVQRGDRAVRPAQGPGPVVQAVNAELTRAAAKVKVNRLSQ